MIKSDLKEKWGKYTDTDKLVDDIMELLTTYRHRNSEHGVCTMLDAYFIAKEPLIQLLMKSENYAGDMRIKMRKEFCRDNVHNEVNDFCRTFINKSEIREMIISKKDDEGKTISDYMQIGKKYFTPEQLLAKTKVVNYTSIPFDSLGFTKKSIKSYDTLRSIIGIFAYITNHTLSETNAKDFSKTTDIKLASGMKTSRAFNRVCDVYGISKLSDYNKLFAQYADMVSDLKRELDYYISVNPYDYLTMSFGNSWSSCHTIDKMNIRNMQNSYSGQYCGGTLSYMLDKTSIITYVVNKDVSPKDGGKIYRNMFHYGNNVLVQGRIYPQGNDGSKDLYQLFRDFMQTEMSVLLEESKPEWKTYKGRSYCNDYTRTSGVHYRDYLYMNDCNISYLASKARQRGTVSIGSVGICPYCGEAISAASVLSHSSCRY